MSEMRQHPTRRDVIASLALSWLSGVARGAGVSALERGEDALPDPGWSESSDGFSAEIEFDTRRNLCPPAFLTSPS